MEVRPQKEQSAKNGRSGRQPVTDLRSNNHRRNSADQKKSDYGGQAHRQQTRLPKRAVILHIIGRVDGFDQFVKGGRDYPESAESPEGKPCAGICSEYVLDDG